MLNSEKRVLIRGIARLLNMMKHPIGLLHGLILIPNLRDDVLQVLEKVGYEKPEKENAIEIDDPKEAFKEIYDDLDEILQWFTHHPTIALKNEGRKLDPVKKVQVNVRALKNKESAFIKGYLNGDFPASITTLQIAIKDLSILEVALLNEINEMIASLPPEERPIAAMEYLALSETQQAFESIMICPPESKLLN